MIAEIDFLSSRLAFAEMPMEKPEVELIVGALEIAQLFTTRTRSAIDAGLIKRIELTSS